MFLILVSALNLIFHHFVGLWQGFVSLFGFRSMAVFDVGTVASQSGSKGWGICHTVVAQLFGERWMRSERYQCVWRAVEAWGGDSTAHLLRANPCISCESPFEQVGNVPQSLIQQKNPKMVKLKLVLQQINVCWPQRNYWGKRFYIVGRTWFQWFRWCLLFSPNGLCFGG